jgi:F-type H+-transporting ATPase subunit b
VKTLLRVAIVLVSFSFALTLSGKSLQATQTESTKPAQAEGTPRVLTEQGKPGQALAERSNEAAGKEPTAGQEEEQLKHSPSVRWIAQKTGMSPQAAYWVFVIFNFAVIAAVMIRYLVKYLPGMFRNRTASIKQSMEDARKASDEANRRLSEIENKLSRLDVDIATIRSEADAVNKAEDARLQASIEEERKKVVVSAQQEIEAAATQARRELKVYAADLAVSLAEKKINVDETTDKALVRSFVAQIPGGKDGR